MYGQPRTCAQWIVMHKLDCKVRINDHTQHAWNERMHEIGRVRPHEAQRFGHFTCDQRNVSDDRENAS